MSALGSLFWFLLLLNANKCQSHCKRPQIFPRCAVSPNSPLRLLRPAVWHTQSSVVPRPRPSASPRPGVVHQNLTHRSPQRGHDPRRGERQGVCCQRLLGQSCAKSSGLQKVPGQPAFRGTGHQILHLAPQLFLKREIPVCQECSATPWWDILISSFRASGTFDQELVFHTLVLTGNDAPRKVNGSTSSFSVESHP